MSRFPWYNGVIKIRFSHEAKLLNSLEVDGWLVPIHPLIFEGQRFALDAAKAIDFKLNGLPPTITLTAQRDFESREIFRS
jgi:hypothetical protein